MKTQKMVKTAKVLEKVCKILQRVAVVCIVVAVVFLGVFTVMNAINPNTVFGIGADFNIVGIGPFTFELSEEIAPNNNAILIYAWSMAVPTVVFVVLICHTLGIFRKILKQMTEGNPFAPAVSGEIRKLAFISLAIGAINNLFGIIEALNVFYVFDLNSLINSLIQNSQIQSVSVNFHFDVAFVAMFFILLLLSYVFRYGEELQKLSDETL